MNRNYVTTALAATIVAVAVAPLSAIAAGKCDAPRNNVEQRACAKAAQGPDELRQFLWRTRMIYALDYVDFATATPPIATAGNDAHVTASSR